MTMGATGMAELSTEETETLRRLLAAGLTSGDSPIVDQLFEKLGVATPEDQERYDQDAYRKAVAFVASGIAPRATQQHTDGEHVFEVAGNSDTGMRDFHAAVRLVKDAGVIVLEAGVQCSRAVARGDDAGADAWRVAISALNVAIAEILKARDSQDYKRTKETP